MTRSFCFWKHCFWRTLFFFGFVVIFLKTIYRFLLDLLQVVAAAEAC